jgi:putative tricarboxylic transport membrane protein
VDIAVSDPGEALELIKAGKVKALGTFSEKRLEAALNIPTLREQGINATYVVNRGLAAPADIPADAHKALEDALHKYYESDSFKKYTKDNIITAAWMDGEKYGKWLDGENVRYTEVLKAMNLIK